MALAIAPGKIALRLGGTKVLKRSVTTFEQLQALVESGLPNASVEPVFAGLPADHRAAFSRRFTEISSDELLSVGDSERLERMARTIALTESAYGRDRTGAQSFLLTPNRHLRGKAPLEIAKTELGARMVEDLLIKIAYGFPS